MLQKTLVGAQGMCWMIGCSCLLGLALGCGPSGATNSNEDDPSGEASASNTTAKPKPQAAPKPKQLVDYPATAFPSMEDGIAAMMVAAKEKDSEKMMAIGQWIGRYHVPAAIEPLEKVAIDESAPVESRIAACQALRFVGPAGSDSLILAVNSQHNLVATNAVKSLVAMRPVIPNLVEQLTKFIDHSNLQVQRAAIQSLARIGPQAESCAPKLLEILNDPDANETLRGEAKRALKAVNPRRSFQD